jgi:DNA mismatch repair protein MutS2
MAIELSPSDSFVRIRLQLTETNEFLLAIHKGDPLHVSNFPDIEKELQLLTIENAVLTTQQMTHIRKAVTMTNELIRFFKDKEIIYPYLKKRTDFLTEDTFIVPAINDIIDKDGIVKDNASVLLASIRNDLQSNRKTCDRIYRAHIQRLKKLGHLADFEESFVNGRRVLGVLAEHKRETKGIILSQSSTGKITFIEPQNVIELNNDRLELEEEEKKEIYRILKELTALIQPYQGLLSDYFKTLIDFDFIHAKAQLAKELNATMPQLLKNGHCIHLMNAFHPVLYLQNKEKKQETQPISCKFSDTERNAFIR